MSGKTAIEWTNKTWNPITGCTKISPGCLNCYAESQTRRFHKKLTGQPFTAWTVRAQRESGQPAVTLHPERLGLPLHWRKPSMVFVNSMSDLFHEDVPFEFIDRVFAVMAVAHWHTFQLLTKRPERMVEYFYYLTDARVNGNLAQYNDESYPMIDWGKVLLTYPLPNVWLGVSVENQRYADERIPELLETPAAVRFISAEPLLERVNILRPAGITTKANPYGIHWVICGGESGPRARPMHPAWVRSLRDQCQVAGVPFFFKQWGEWAPFNAINAGHWSRTSPQGRVSKGQLWDGEGKLMFGGRSIHIGTEPGPPWESLLKVGKAKAGALLDGREWREFPRTG